MQFVEILIDDKVLPPSHDHEPFFSLGATNMSKVSFRILQEPVRFNSEFDSYSMNENNLPGVFLAKHDMVCDMLLRLADNEYYSNIRVHARSLLGILPSCSSLSDRLQKALESTETLSSFLKAEYQQRSLYKMLYVTELLLGTIPFSTSEASEKYLQYCALFHTANAAEIFHGLIRQCFDTLGASNIRGSDTRLLLRLVLRFLRLVFANQEQNASSRGSAQPSRLPPTWSSESEQTAFLAILLELCWRTAGCDPEKHPVSSSPDSICLSLEAISTLGCLADSTHLTVIFSQPVTQDQMKDLLLSVGCSNIRAQIASHIHKAADHPPFLEVMIKLCLDWLPQVSEDYSSTSTQFFDVLSDLVARCEPNSGTVDLLVKYATNRLQVRSEVIVVSIFHHIMLFMHNSDCFD